MYDSHVNAFDPDEGFARVFGKGAKERVVPRLDGIQQSLKLFAWWTTLFDEGWNRGRTFSEYAGKAISRKMVWVLSKGMQKKLELKKKSVHMGYGILLQLIY